MKKLFAIVTIVSFFAACNNSSEKTTTDTKDSVSVESPLTDAVITADSVTRRIKDSTVNLIDTLRK